MELPEANMAADTLQGILSLHSSHEWQMSSCLIMCLKSQLINIGAFKEPGFPLNGHRN